MAARFTATIEGSRGPVTRTGGRGSGLVGHVHGERVGVRIACFVDAEGRDVVRVYRTDGRETENVALIAEFTEGS